MQASQGSSYPWWLVAVAKRNVLLCECVGKMVAASWGQRHSALTRLRPNLSQYVALCGPLLISHAIVSR